MARQPLAMADAEQVKAMTSTDSTRKPRKHRRQGQVQMLRRMLAIPLLIQQKSIGGGSDKVLNEFRIQI